MGEPIRIAKLSRAEQIAARCVHFTGIISQERCAAGVRYEDVRLEHEPIEYVRYPSKTMYTKSVSHPCLAHLNLGGATCAKRCTLSPEEVAAKLEREDREIGHMFEAWRRIEAVAGSAGTVECPRCKGTLRFTRAASNNHVHARCDTDNCLAWMQ